MNERIENLMLEATKDMPQGYYVPGEYFQKFAELIVRECMDIVEDEDTGDVYGKSARLAIIRIKQHFGVEE